MRLLLAGLTVTFVIGLEMAAYPAADGSLTPAVASGDDETGMQSGALAKADRLFAIRAPDPEC